ncbi:MAG: AMP-binding protein [Acidimicrobiales bacterium]|nr:AMP-binding protein [Acidimicrobiales bacterium]
MFNLVAIDMEPSNALIEAIRAAWENGDAFWVVDQRLRHKAKSELISAVKPRSIVSSESGVVLLDDSVPMMEGDALVVATSGTTGSPRFVVHTMESLLFSANAVHEFLNFVPGADHWLACLPLAHIGGLGVVIRSILTSSKLSVIKGPDPNAIDKANQEGANFVSLVKSVLDRINADSWSQIVIGGMAPPSELAQNIHYTYGLSESGGGIVYDGLPLTGVEIKLDELKRVTIRSKSLLRSYREGSTNNEMQAGLNPKDNDGWFITSDIGEIGTDGKLKILGRLDDVINSGGEKIWPDQVEEVIRAELSLTEVAVIGLPDDKWGEIVVVVLTKGETEVTLHDIGQAVEHSIGSWAKPRQLIQVDELPKTSIGKVSRKLLRTLLSDRY